jgi:hypothetical protein
LAAGMACSPSNDLAKRFLPVSSMWPRSSNIPSDGNVVVTMCQSSSSALVLCCLSPQGGLHAT